MTEPNPAKPDREETDRRARFRRSLTSEAASRIKLAAKRPAFYQLGDESEAEADTRSKQADYVAVKGLLQERLLSEIGDETVLGRREDDVAVVVEGFVHRVLESEQIPLNEQERSRLAEELTEETIGLGPLSPLMADPAVTDILVIAPDKVYVERFGKLEKTEVRFRDADHIMRVIERIAAQMGRRIDASSPMADLRLPDGSRVNATLPPASIDGPTLSIRRFGRRRLRRRDLLELGMMSEEMSEFLATAVSLRTNILVSGGTGAGKSTLLGALLESARPTERIITIEDTAELILDQEHVVRMETRPANVEGRGRITQRDLVINSLRMRPDRIIVGEVRGPEALDMLQAMNTGHDGGMSTIHANSPRDALSRLETMVLMAGEELPSRAIREQIVSAIQLLVHIRRYEDGVRRIERVTEITGMEGDVPLLQDIFTFRRLGMEGRRLRGEFSATGIVPRFVEGWRRRGVSIPLGLFHPRSDHHVE
ncbi:MAG: CpaF family protein [Nitrospira sp.]|nr:CpaF family protein [Nitrospira sp.]